MVHGANMTRSRFPKFEIALIACGIFLLLWSAKYAALMLFGVKDTATIEYSVRKYGASRGTSFRVHYRFVLPDGGTRDGTTSMRSDTAPTGTLRVRYLRFFPQLNCAGGTGAMQFFAVVTAVPGVVLLALGARLLYLRRHA
jgi:hypothetical protein